VERMKDISRVEACSAKTKVGFYWWFEKNRSNVLKRSCRKESTCYVGDAVLSETHKEGGDSQ